MKENFFTKRKIITFYSKIEKHKIFEKIKIFYQTLYLSNAARGVFSSEAWYKYWILAFLYLFSSLSL